jgi:phospholipid/cholesterol/gamma-HCH transport system permease protein
MRSEHTPSIDTQGAAVVLRGQWTAAQLGRPGVWQALQQQLRKVAKTEDKSSTWDLRELQQLDHLGAQLLCSHWGGNQGGNRGDHQGINWPATLHALPAQQALLARVAQFDQAAPQALPASQHHGVLHGFSKLGTRVLRLLGHLRDFVQLLGQLFLDTLRLARAPRSGPWRDVSGHLYHIGASALPITALVGFLIGVVLAYLTSQQLRQFGADAFIVDILGISLIRELGPMLAAILIAGRSGSAITAQIGVMRVTEELDAMRVMGIAHGFRLVLPRVLALCVAMPLISVWTTLAALLGGMVAADASLGITPSFFISSLPSAVQLANLWLALSKSLVFGALIALIGCHWGLRVQPNTESLGQGTTASVVTAITVVILVNAVFAVLFKDVGL